MYRLYSLFITATIFTAAFISGCVPSPDDNQALPTFSILSTFYSPQVSSQETLWRHTEGSYSSYYVRVFDHNGGNPYSLIYPTASYFTHTDTATKIVTQDIAMISDSIIIEYVRSSATDTLRSAIVRMQSLLEEGRRFVAADNFITASGASVKIEAYIDKYYGESSINFKTYSDVYHIIYTVTSLNSAKSPTEKEYQPGASLGIYYVKTAGPLYIVSKDSDGNIISTDEVIETRTR